MNEGPATSPGRLPTEQKLSFPRHPLALLFGPMLAAVLLHLLFLGLYVSRNGQDLSALVCVATWRAGRPPFEVVRHGLGWGYDGQFYYALGRAPWRPTEQAVRHLRILYPAICWLCSGGDARLLLWVMPGVNLAAIAGLTGLGGALALRRGLSAWWGLLVPLAVDAGLPALRDLTDPVATLAVAGLLTAWLARARGWVLVLWAAAAVFSREQNVAVVGLVLLAAAWSSRWRTAAGLGGVLLLWLVWVGVIWAGYGYWPFLRANGSFGIPLAGLLDDGLFLNSSSVRQVGFDLAARLHLLLQVGLAVYLVTRRGDLVLRLFLVAAVVLTVSAGHSIYRDFWSYGRVLVWLPLGLTLAGLDTRRGWVVWLTAPSVLGTLAAIRGGIF